MGIEGGGDGGGKGGGLGGGGEGGGGLGGGFGGGDGVGGSGGGEENDESRKKERLIPNFRVVSYMFSIPGWRATKIDKSSKGSCPLYLYENIHDEEK